MTLIAEDMLLLLLDDESGKPLLDSTRLGRVLAGAVLLELAVDGRVSPATEDDVAKGARLVVRNRQGTGDPLLDRAVSLLIENKPMKLAKAAERLQARGSGSDWRPAARGPTLARVAISVG